MKNEKFRKALAEMSEDQEWEGESQPILLDYYDNSILGVTEGGHVVYSYDKMIEEHMEDEKCSYEEAVEWLDYNTMRAIPYMASVGAAPIVVMDTVESIMERYGE